MNVQEKTDMEGRTAGCAEYSPLPPLKLNPDEYREDLKGLNLTTDQENELLQCVWHIMSTFVDLGWGVDSIHLMLPELFNEQSKGDPQRIEHDRTRKEDFE